MCETELWYFQNAQYTSYCQLSGSACLEPSLSIAYKVYSYANYSFPFGPEFTLSSAGASCPLLSDSVVTAYGDFLVDQMNSETGQLYYGFFMAEDTVGAGYSVRTRSGMPFGGPLLCDPNAHEVRGEVGDERVCGSETAARLEYR